MTNLDTTRKADLAPSDVWNVYDIPRRRNDLATMAMLRSKGITAKVLTRWGKLKPARQQRIRAALAAIAV